jgi:hypothetical protein
MSCFFLTLLCWDMAGDKGGWLQALWVPVVGVVMAFVIWVFDRLLMSGAPLVWSWSPDVSFLFFSCLPNDQQSSSKSNPQSDTTQSLQLVRSSLHQSAAAQGTSNAFLDQEGIA